MPNRFFSYQNTALRIIGHYGGELPLHYFLKQYFAQNKKHGSRDRRWISHFCYSYYRLGHALKDISAEERLRVGIYLCTSSLSALEGFFPDSWPLDKDNPEDRAVFIASLYPDFSTEAVFPWKALLCKDVDYAALCRSYFIQPDMFLRIRPNRGEAVREKLREAGIVFREMGPDCLVLPNGSRIEELLAVNRDIVVQDYASQQIAGLFPDGPVHSVWDCCAASGGKTLLVHDRFPAASLTVSDIRKSILINLRKRLQQAGIPRFQSFETDLSHPLPVKRQYDFVLVDAPCSGSGTWGRTPEALYYFDPAQLASITALQEKIAVNAFAHVKPGGWLLYITCSLFEQENDAVVEKLLRLPGAGEEKRKFIGGYTLRADSLFASLIRRE